MTLAIKLRLKAFPFGLRKGKRQASGEWAFSEKKTPSGCEEAGGGPHYDFPGALSSVGSAIRAPEEDVPRAQASPKLVNILVISNHKKRGKHFRGGEPPPSEKAQAADPTHFANELLCTEHHQDNTSRQEDQV